MEPINLLSQLVYSFFSYLTLNNLIQEVKCLGKGNFNLDKIILMEGEYLGESIEEMLLYLLKVTFIDKIKTIELISDKAKVFNVEGFRDNINWMFTDTVELSEIRGLGSNSSQSISIKFNSIKDYERIMANSPNCVYWNALKNVPILNRVYELSGEFYQMIFLIGKQCTITIGGGLKMECGEKLCSI